MNDAVEHINKVAAVDRGAQKAQARAASITTMHAAIGKMTTAFVKVAADKKVAQLKKVEKLETQRGLKKH